MQIRAVPPHYQLVHTNFDISPFSVISYYEKIIFICAYCNDDLQLLEKRNRRQPQPKSRIIRNRNVADPRRIDL